MNNYMTEIEKIRNIEIKLKESANILSDKFDELGFALIVFDFYKPGIGNYISNAQRKDMIVALRELVDRLEKRQDIPPTDKTIQ